MTIALDHTIVHVRDREAAAADLVGVLGLRPPTHYGPFTVVRLDNGGQLYFADSLGEPVAMHYAFLVDEDGFDAVRGRMEGRGRRYWADPFEQRPGEIGTDNGRGLYWRDPDGNKLEILTIPDGGWPEP